MDFGKRHNAFCDIPGFDASKGERIVKALQKLWQKIEFLEQVRISERKSELPRNAKVEENEGLTVTDVQFKLLVLQLQYARSLLWKKLNEDKSIFYSKIKDSEKEENLIPLDRNAPTATNPDFGSKSVSQETQTSNHSTDDLNPSKKSDIQKSVIKTNVPVSSDNQFLKSKHSSEKTLRTFPTSLKPHYHLKLDDVPFILGASSTASHSVVANVQNIIAMMKSHNKALCGPKHPNKSTLINTQSTHSAEADSSEGNSNDVTKMVNELSRDLAVLASKQKKLMESIDAAQAEKEGSGVNLIRNFQDRGNNIKDKSVENLGSRRYQSNSESEVKFYADVRNVPKMKEKDLVKCSVQQKEIVSNMRSHASNFSIMDRRKLLRSLHNFKTHLSQEDISWD